MEFLSWLFGNTLLVGLILGGALLIIGIFLGYEILRAVMRKKQESRKTHLKATSERQIANAGKGHQVALIQLTGTHPGNNWTIYALPATMGRSHENQIVLDDRTVSAQHAKIYYNGELHAVCIEDLDSRNGVFVNGYPTCRNILQDMDEIMIADQKLTIRYSEPYLSKDEK
jgi:hypothetical protein